MKAEKSCSEKTMKMFLRILDVFPRLSSLRNVYAANQVAGDIEEISVWNEEQRMPDEKFQAIADDES